MGETLLGRRKLIEAAPPVPEVIDPFAYLFRVLAFW